MPAVETSDDSEFLKGIGTIIKSFSGGGGGGGGGGVNGSGAERGSKKRKAFVIDGKVLPSTLGFPAR